MLECLALYTTQDIFSPNMRPQNIPHSNNSSTSSGLSVPSLPTSQNNSLLAPTESKTQPDPHVLYPPLDADVRILTDDEDVEIDEEVPLENFLQALNEGNIKIMSEAQRKQEYASTARICRSVSVGDTQAFKEWLRSSSAKRAQTARNVEGMKSPIEGDEEEKEHDLPSTPATPANPHNHEFLVPVENEHEYSGTVVFG